MCDFEEQIRKLVDILALTLECGVSSGGNQAAYVESLQRLLANVSASAFSVDSRRSAPMRAPAIASRGILRVLANITSTKYPATVSDNVVDAYNQGQNVTSAIPFLNQSQPTSRQKSFKLHRLEIIKVIVLIVVISIILLTTCRMVFQLFLRFRPEKHN